MKLTNAIAALLTCCAATMVNAQSVSDITDLILVTGQSNVTASETAYDPALDDTHPRVFAYTSAGDWEVADLHQAWDVDGWRPGNGSLNQACLDDPNCVPRQPYNSFAFHFAKTVVQNDPDRVVGIIIASAPGEGILHWDSGTQFWQVIQNKVTAAINAQGIKSTLDGVLWHQGETDWQFNGTSDPDASATERSDPTYYPQKLDSVMSRMRNQNWFTQNKPFICGETKQAPVNGRLMALNSDNDPWSGCVMANDLPTKEMDTTVSPPVLGTHFNAVALRQLGYRYGLKYLQMTETTEDTEAPVATVTFPAANADTISSPATLTGTMNDSGGSGVDKLSVVLWSYQTRSFIDLNGNALQQWTQYGASLPAGNPDTAQWSLDVDLPSGRYVMTTYSSDKQGNFDRDNRVIRDFFVASSDTIAPVATLDHPPANGNTVTASPTLSGTITDSGGSGVARLAVVIWSNQTGSFVDLSGNALPQWSQFSATLASQYADTSDWSIDTSLPGGRYVVTIYPSDASSNYSHANRVSRSFIVGAIDTIAPTATITSPAVNNTLLTSPTLTGTISDTGGAGVARVAIVIWSNQTASFVDLNGNALAGWTQFEATLSGTSEQSDWSIATGLTSGGYVLTIYPSDAAGNFDRANRVSRAFLVAD